MGLQKSYTLKAGTELSSIFPEFASCTKTTDYEINSAYIKINYLQGGKDGITIFVYVYKSRGEVELLDQQSYDFIPSVEDSSPNFIRQGYEFLKSLPEFNNAIDVLE